MLRYLDSINFVSGTHRYRKETINNVYPKEPILLTFNSYLYPIQAGNEYDRESEIQVKEHHNCNASFA